jgi:predicted  nucleic acid-binding Zn-ribbon protein
MIKLIIVGAGAIALAVYIGMQHKQIQSLQESVQKYRVAAEQSAESVEKYRAELEKVSAVLVERDAAVEQVTQRAAGLKKELEKLKKGDTHVQEWSDAALPDAVRRLLSTSGDVCTD